MRPAAWFAGFGRRRGPICPLRPRIAQAAWGARGGGKNPPSMQNSAQKPFLRAVLFALSSVLRQLGPEYLPLSADDLKPSIGHRVGLDLPDARDTRTRGALSQPPPKLGDGWLRTGCFHLHLSVGEVANGSGEPELESLGAGPPAEPNSLYNSADAVCDLSHPVRTFPDGLGPDAEWSSWCRSPNGRSTLANVSRQILRPPPQSCRGAS